MKSSVRGYFTKNTPGISSSSTVIYPGIPLMKIFPEGGIILEKNWSFRDFAWVLRVLTKYPVLVLQTSSFRKGRSVLHPTAPVSPVDR